MGLLHSALAARPIALHEALLQIIQFGAVIRTFSGKKLRHCVPVTIDSRQDGSDSPGFKALRINILDTKRYGGRW